MILAEMILNLKFEGGMVTLNGKVVPFDLSSIFKKRDMIANHYESIVSEVYSIDFSIGDTVYILGFDHSLYYFYIFNCEKLDVDLFFTKDDIQDKTFACLLHPIFRKEIEFDS